VWSHVPSRPAAEARSSGSLSGDSAKHSSRCRRRAQPQLDLPRRYRSHRLPQRDGRCRRKAALHRLLHAQPLARLSEPNATRAGLGRLAAPDHAPVGCGPWQQWFGTQPCRSTASSPGPMTRWTGCPTTSRKSRTRVSGSSSSESGFGGRARPRARYEDPKQGPDSCLSARQLCASERQLPAVLSGFER
jgi:hypothetical protein